MPPALATAVTNAWVSQLLTAGLAPSYAVLVLPRAATTAFAVEQV